MTEWPPFSSDVFLDTLKEVYVLPGRKALASCGGFTVRTLVSGRNRALSGFFPSPFILEPVEPPPDGGIPVRYLHDVAVETVPADPESHRGHSVAPFVDWRGFDSWDRYLATRKPGPGMDPIRKVQQKQRRLEREFGPTRLVVGDNDPGLLDTLLRWKVDQYARTGALNRLAVKQNVDFIRELHRRGFYHTTSFRAGEVLLGGKLEVRYGRRKVSRLTVYNREFARFSPGSIMELECVRSSYEAGDEEMDFLMGDQAYKFTWATHMRVLGTVGEEPWLKRTAGAVRGRVGGAVRGKPGYNAYREGLRWGAALARRTGWR